MKIERVVILIFTVLGTLAGTVSSYLDLIFAVLISLAIWFVPSAFMLRFFPGKKRKWFIQNSIITFVLIWLMVWILLYTR